MNDRGNLVIKHGKDEMNGKIIKLTISKRASGPYSIFVNRKKVFPEGSAFFLSFFRNRFRCIHDSDPLFSSNHRQEALATASGSASASSSTSEAAAAPSAYDLMEARRRLDELERLMLAPKHGDASKVERLVNSFFSILLLREKRTKQKQNYWHQSGNTVLGGHSNRGVRAGACVGMIFLLSFFPRRSSCYLRGVLTNCSSYFVLFFICAHNKFQRKKDKNWRKRVLGLLSLLLYSIEATGRRGLTMERQFVSRFSRVLTRDSISCTIATVEAFACEPELAERGGSTLSSCAVSVLADLGLVG